jgi:hypothetical protein
MGDRLGPYLLGPNDTPENGIYTGDARELAKAIPDESVDLIFTDPVYDHIDDYRWLAETAARVLRPNSACLAWYSKAKVLDVLPAMSKSPLDYIYDLEYTVVAKTYRLVAHHIFCWTTPCAWFNKGKFAPEPWVVDTVISTHASKSGFKWNKNPEAISGWLAGFVSREGIVFDPFTGGGTVPAVCKMLGRRYLAFEIDPNIAEMARQRVRETQPPLFVPKPQQAKMDL